MNMKKTLIVSTLAFLAVVAIGGAANAQTATSTSTGAYIVLPEGNFYYTAIAIMNPSNNGTIIPAGSYYNPDTGAFFQSGSAVSGTTTGGTTSTPTAPGVPNTGGGGDVATNMMILLSSISLAAGAAIFMVRHARA